MRIISRAWETCLVASMLAMTMTACMSDRHAAITDIAALHASAMNNSGVSWDGDDIGLTVRIVGTHEQWLLKTRQFPRELLLDALSDTNRWVAAHVILTLRNDHPFRCDRHEWNGLKVEISADNESHIDPGQMPMIRSLWIGRGASGGL